MTRRELEHVIRAAAATSDQREIIVIGSQAILGSHPDAPASLTESMEADVFPKDAPERAIIIDGSIGEMSLFHSTFGYYAHGVGETTATLPDQWRSRLIRVENANTMGAVGWCLEPHDLAVSKLVAGREKDLAYVEAMLHAALIRAELVSERIAHTSTLSPEARQRANDCLKKWAQG